MLIRRRLARHLRINFELHSAHAIRNFQAPAKTFPLQLDAEHASPGRRPLRRRRTSISVRTLSPPTISIRRRPTRCRCLPTGIPSASQPSPTEMSPVRSNNEPGFFEAEALLGFGASPAPAAKAAQRLSENGDRAVRHVALDAVGEAGAQLSGVGNSAAHAASGRSIRPRAFQHRDTGLPAERRPMPPAFNMRIDFVRASRLRGGTDIQHALQTGLQQARPFPARAIRIW